MVSGYSGSAKGLSFSRDRRQVDERWQRDSSKGNVMDQVVTRMREKREKERKEGVTYQLGPTQITSHHHIHFFPLQEILNFPLSIDYCSVRISSDEG
jgi:hypothetical protein